MTTQIGIQDKGSGPVLSHDTSDIEVYSPTTIGAITRPLQPSFRAINTILRANVTGDGTAFPIVNNTELFDQNGDYDTATGLFTAPVTGIYYFELAINTLGLTAGHTTGLYRFRINGVAVVGPWDGNIGSLRDSTGQAIINGTMLYQLTAADTVQPEVRISNGALVVDIPASTAGVNELTYFSGCLIA